MPEVAYERVSQDRRTEIEQLLNSRVLSLAHEGEFSKGKVKKQLVLFLDEVETCVCLHGFT